MCVPCKVVINEEGQRAAALACTLRKIMAGAYDKKLSDDANDAMFHLAQCEVEHIKAVRRETLRHLESVGVPERWLQLVMQVL